jgi:cytochrome c2
VLLLALLLLLFVSSPSALVRGDDDAVDFDESAEEEQAEEVVPEDEPVVEEDAEPEAVLEPDVVADESKPVAEEVKGVPVPGESKSSPSFASKAKNAVGPLVDEVVNRGKSAIDRIKNMSKSDAKKVAAAALGIWGVSVGVGWLAQTANKN